MGFSATEENTLMNELYSESPEYEPTQQYTFDPVTVTPSDEAPETEKKPFPWWLLLVAYGIYEFTQ